MRVAWRALLPAPEPKPVTLYGLRLSGPEGERDVWFSTEAERLREIAHLHSIGHGGAILRLTRKTVKISEEMES